MPNRDIAELLERTLIIVAHPDDECIGAGALLQRIPETALVFCTDGGPRDRYFWDKYGSRERYSEVRRQEAEKAAKIIGVATIRILPIVDQELYLHLREARSILTAILKEFRPRALLTMAYEGGHPDHDCCAYLGNRIGAEQNLPVWEFPIYHRRNGNGRKQEFVEQIRPPDSIRITPAELERKQEMLSAYASQGIGPNVFDLTVEQFRRQPSYDFAQPPTAEVANYEAWQWPIKATQVCEAFLRMDHEINSAGNNQ